MKRETFSITYNDQTVTKSTWNACNREVENIIRKIAQEEGMVYSLVDSHSEKEGFYHVQGHRLWERMDGKLVMFNIEKVQS